MNAREPFSDTTLERMLLRRAERAEPGALRDSVLAGIESIEPRRPVWGFGRVLPSPGRSIHPQPMLVAVALLLLALLAGALAAGAAWLRQHQVPPIELTPTGIEVMTPGDLTGAEVVEDGVGTLWAVDAGRVTRFDSVSGDHRTWTVADDAAFDAWVTTPARAGGVWMWSGDRIVRFTGDGFGEAVPSPGRPMLLDEAPDGTLWAATESGDLVHWDGAQWLIQSTPELPPDQQIVALLADSGGGLWTASYGGGAPASLAHLESARWSVVDWTAGSLGPGASLSEGVDGAIWMTFSDSVRMGRLDDGRWTYVDGPGGSRVDWLSVADDGSIWASLNEPYGSTVAGHVARYADGRWTTYGPAEGLTGTVGNVSTTSAGVFVGTNRGLLRYDDGTWTPLWRNGTASGAPSIYDMAPFAGLSRDELWTADMQGLWHFVDGAWQEPIRAPGLSDSQVTGLALGDDGSLWVATVDGVAVLANGRWSMAWDEKVLSIDLAADGSAWVGDFERITHLARTATGFESLSIACPMPAITLTVAADGTVWLGGLGYSGKAGLAHFDGTTCEEVDLHSDLSSNTTVEVGSIVADPSGGVLIQATEFLVDPSTDEYPETAMESVIRLANGARTVLGGPRPVAYATIRNIAIAPDGQVWWARDKRDLSTSTGPAAAPGTGLSRFDGEHWVQVLSGVDARGPIAVTGDGTVWFQGTSGILRIQAGAPPAP